MAEEKKASSEKVHEVCHNPCSACNSQGYLENKEICPSCAGTGCKDEKLCIQAGGLNCES